MKKLYFTALYPASDLEMKLKRIRLESNIYSPLPPIVPLMTYKHIIKKNHIKFNIDITPEFKTNEIIKCNDWLIEAIPLEPIKHLTNETYNILGLERPGLLIGLAEGDQIKPETISSVIRNWDLVFYELIIWDDENTYNNIELIEHWKIKKKKLK